MNNCNCEHEHGESCENNKEHLPASEQIVTHLRDWMHEYLNQYAKDGGLVELDDGHKIAANQLTASYVREHHLDKGYIEVDIKDVPLFHSKYQVKDDIIENLFPFNVGFTDTSFELVIDINKEEISDEVIDAIMKEHDVSREEAEKIIELVKGGN